MNRKYGVDELLITLDGHMSRDKSADLLSKCFQDVLERDPELARQIDQLGADFTEAARKKSAERGTRPQPFGKATWRELFFRLWAAGYV